jgi:hypothetical protein
VPPCIAALASPGGRIKLFNIAVPGEARGIIFKAGFFLSACTCRPFVRGISELASSPYSYILAKRNNRDIRSQLLRDRITRNCVRSKPARLFFGSPDELCLLHSDGFFHLSNFLLKLPA